MPPRGVVWRKVPPVVQFADTKEAERRDFEDPARDLFDSEHGAELRTDGDDNPVYAMPKARKVATAGHSVKVKLRSGKSQTVEVIEPGQIIETVAVKPRQILSAR